MGSCRETVLHLKSVHLKSIVNFCPLCWKIFNDDNLLRDHFKSVHKLLRIHGFFQCHICSALIEGRFIAYHFLQIHGNRTIEADKERQDQSTSNSTAENNTNLQDETSATTELDLEKLLEVRGPEENDIEISNFDENELGEICSSDLFCKEILSPSEEQSIISREEGQINQVRTKKN